jgi:hypothetical protein
LVVLERGVALHLHLRLRFHLVQRRSSSLRQVQAQPLRLVVRHRNNSSSSRRLHSAVVVAVAAAALHGRMRLRRRRQHPRRKGGQAGPHPRLHSCLVEARLRLAQQISSSSSSHQAFRHLTLEFSVLGGHQAP